MLYIVFWCNGQEGMSERLLYSDSSLFNDLVLVQSRTVQVNLYLAAVTGTIHLFIWSPVSES